MTRTAFQESSFREAGFQNKIPIERLTWLVVLSLS
jgi:hypothetical protein